MRSVMLVAAALAAGFFGGSMSRQPATAAPKPNHEPADQYGRGYSLTDAADVSGLWVKRPGADKPFAAVYSQAIGGKPVAVAGFSTSEKRTAARGHDFAVVAQDGLGVWFQIIDAKGKPHFLPVTALLKLEGEAVEGGDAKAVPAPMPAKPHPLGVCCDGTAPAARPANDALRAAALRLRR